MQAMQPRQASKCPTHVSLMVAVAFGDHLHQVDPAARRIHLLIPQHVCGAHGQAEAAVHAFVDQLARWRVVRVVPARACWMDALSLRH